MVAPVVKPTVSPVVKPMASPVVRPTVSPTVRPMVAPMAAHMVRQVMPTAPAANKNEAARAAAAALVANLKRK
jgi:hypothetical protein